MAIGTTQLGWRERWADRENDRRGKAYAAALDAWRRDDQELRTMLGTAQSFIGLPASATPSWLDLRRRETLLWTGDYVGMVEPLYEPHLGPLTYQGFLQTQPGPPTPLRTAPVGGAAAITDKRMVFQSSHQREWAFPKTVGAAYTPDHYTLIRVSNRTKVSGLAVPATEVRRFRFHLALGVAAFHGDRAGFVAYLEQLVGHHQRLRPSPPRGATPDEAPVMARIGPGAVVVGIGALVILLFLGLVFASPDTEETLTTAPTRSTAAPVETFSPRPSSSPSPSPSPSPTAATQPETTGPPKPKPKPEPKRTATKPVNLCGAPSNPYGYNFCGGSLIYNPKPDVCLYFRCIDYFREGKGYMIQCNDGMVSMSGGRQGSCSWHDGTRRPVYQ